MKKLILMSMALVSASSFAEGSGTLTIKGVLTNYNECSFDKINNDLKCSKNTAYKKIEKPLKLKNSKGISTFYIY